MSQTTLLVLSRVRPRELVRTLSKPRQKVYLRTPGEALDQLNRLPARAVILDGGLEQEQDFRLIGRIKGQHPGIPLVYLAEGGSESTAVEAFRSGVRDYYPKPVNLFDLRRNVLRLIALRKPPPGRRRPYIWPPSGMDSSLKMANPTPSSKLLRAAAYIEEHYESDITLPELAELAGMSRYHFCRAFRAAFGESPIRYLNHFRVERAKLMLCSTDLSVSEVASLSGFNDPSNFSRIFKRLVSLSPSRYRRTGAPR